MITFDPKTWFIKGHKVPNFGENPAFPGTLDFGEGIDRMCIDMIAKNDLAPNKITKRQGLRYILKDIIQLREAPHE